MHLSIIVPVYNEEKILEKNINKFNEYLRRQSYSYEIIIVNDGSSDKTEKIAKNLTANNSNIKLKSHKKNRGKGDVVKDGLLSAHGRYRLFIDADNATSIEHVEKIWPHFNNGYNVVIGSRSIRDAKNTKQIKPQSIWKRILGICGNFVIQALSIKGIWDTQCGFKAFTKESVDKIIPKLTINRWGFDVEILVLARLYNFKIATMPVSWVNSKDSKVGVKGYFISLIDVLKIKYNLITNKYLD